MKKILTAVLAFCMVLSFSACKDKDKKPSDKESKEKTSVTGGDYRPESDENGEALSGITYENHTRYLQIVNNGNVFENGLVNMTNGVEVLPLEYEKIVRLYSERYPFALVGENKSAVVDLEKGEVIKLDFEITNDLETGYYSVKKDQKYGVCDESFELVTECEYDYPVMYYDKNGFVVRSIDHHYYGLFDKDGELIADDVSTVRLEGDYIAVYLLIAGSNTVPVYDKNFNFIKELRTYFGQLDQGLYYSDDDERNVFIYNDKLEIVLEKKNCEQWTYFENGTIYIDGEVFDKNGKKLRDADTIKALPEDDTEESSFYYVASEKVEIALYNTKGDEVLKTQGERFSTADGITAILKQDGWHIYDIDGNELTEGVIPYEYEIYEINSYNATFYNKDMKMAVYTHKGQLLVDFSDERFKDYRFFSPFNNGTMTLTGENDKTAVVNEKGEIVIEGEYRQVRDFGNNVVICEKKTDLGFAYDIFTKNGELLCQCDEYSSYGINIIKCTSPDENSDATYIDRNGIVLAKDVVENAELIFKSERNDYGMGIALADKESQRKYIVDSDNNILGGYYYIGNIYD